MKQKVTTLLSILKIEIIRTYIPLSSVKQTTIIRISTPLIYHLCWHE
jgi:hypothetical protein